MSLVTKVLPPKKIGGPLWVLSLEDQGTDGAEKQIDYSLSL